MQQNHTDTETQNPNIIALHNLSELSTRMESIQCFISQSINTNTLLPKQHMETLSNEIFSAIHHVIINATALVGTCPITPPPSTYNQTLMLDSKHIISNKEQTEVVVEFDAVELLAKHFHYCQICGKGFTRDANLRMHMRAHGDQFKTLEALAKKPRGETRFNATRFSCPFEGCKRNKLHKKFRSLKSMFCLRNHFKRSHCPKTHTCGRCQKKSFAVLSDLKSHMKQCRGESTWKCSCGTTFSRKEKLFGHVALFQGHSPVLEVGEEELGERGKTMAAVQGEAVAVGGLLTKESHLDGLPLPLPLPDGFFDDLENFGFDSL